MMVLPLVGLAACAPEPYASRMDGATPQVSAPQAGETGPERGNAPGVGKDMLQLKGLTPVQLRKVLGTPGFQRRDAPAEIWQYRGTGCTLDLFLYDDSAAGQKVVHWSVRSPSRVGDAECFHQLVEQGRAGQSGG